MGLPRSGSTLIEQILSSHSKVEGTMELANIPRLVQTLQGRDDYDSYVKFWDQYFDALTHRSTQDLTRDGEEYLAETLIYRHARKPFFTDKNPNNFRNIGLLQLILPNAKIIDARRGAMACCFSNFKQLFAMGQEFSYSQEDVGSYYRLYIEMMEHWERVLPGKVLRIRHEALVEDLEGHVRRILDFCGLNFEPACLEFHKTERRRAYGELRAGAPARQPRGCRPMASFRALARTPQERTAGARRTLRRPAPEGATLMGSRGARTIHIDSRSSSSCSASAALIGRSRFEEALPAAQTMLRSAPEHRDLLYVLAVSQRYLGVFRRPWRPSHACESLHPGSAACIRNEATVSSRHAIRELHWNRSWQP